MFHPCAALAKKGAKRFDKRFACLYWKSINPVASHPSKTAVRILNRLGRPGISDGFRRSVKKNKLARFGIPHFKQANLRKFKFTAIANINGDKIMLSPDDTDGLLPAVVLEVTHEKGGASTSLDVTEVLKGAGDIGAVSDGFVRQEFSDNAQHMLRPLAWGYKFLDAICERE